MNDFALALRQVRYENTAFWRNPVAAFFTIVFPLMFLVIFNLVFPAHGLPQEVGGTPNGVGPALAQPRHQHVAGAGGDGQQRVIAPLASDTAPTPSFGGFGLRLTV